MKKYILILTLFIVGFTSLTAQNSTEPYYDVFSIDALSLSKTVFLWKGLFFQASYERQYKDRLSLFFSQNIGLNFSEETIFAHTVVGHRSYFEEDLNGYYIQPYACFNVVTQTKSITNNMVQKENFPLIGGGLGMGRAFDYNKLHLDVGIGIGISHPLKDDYYLTSSVGNDDLLGFGILLNAGVALINTGLMILPPSYFNVNIGFKRERKPKAKDF